MTPENAPGPAGVRVNQTTDEIQGLRQTLRDIWLDIEAMTEENVRDTVETIADRIVAAIGVQDGQE